MILRSVQNLAGGLLHLVYPPACWICGEAGSVERESICSPCAAAIAADPHPTCPRCSSTVGPYAAIAPGCPHCRGEAFAFDGAFRMGPYEGALRDVILRMKRRGSEGLAEAVGRLFGARLSGRLTDRIDAVVPLPLHWSRRWNRGFNQSEVVSECVATALGAHHRPRWLRRVRRTDLQTRQSSPQARKANVQGAFATAGRCDATGKTILLVDDVLTTGATASEAARALRPLRPAKILVAVLAHGG